MSSDRELMRIVQSWLEEGANVLPDRVLDDVLERVPVTPQRRPWWRAWRKQLMNPTLKFAVAGTVVVLVAAVALGVYFARPAVGPAATPTPGQTPTTAVTTAAPPTNSAQPTTEPTAAPSDAPFVAFLVRTGGFGTDRPSDLWAMRADGTGAREVFPDLPAYANVAWSKDGTQLLVETFDADGGSHVYLAEVGDAIGPFVDTGFGTAVETACNDKIATPRACQDWAFTFAPDGERVVFLQTCTVNPPGCGFMTILDLRTGQLTELSATLRTGSSMGAMSPPVWSPDGAQIAYVIEDPWVEGLEQPTPDSHLYLVDVGGRNLRQVDLGVPRVDGPSWSPDGQRIAFTADIWLTETELEQNIYTVNVDGTDLRQLTTNGRSATPEWVSGDRIRFLEWIAAEPSTTYWLIDADGSNVVELVDLHDHVAAVLEPLGLDAPAGHFHWQPAEAWYQDR